MTAPITAHTILPIIELTPMPSKLNTQPPTTPPMMPRKRSTMQPFPSLLVNLQAMKPAKIPQIILEIRPDIN